MPGRIHNRWIDDYPELAEQYRQALKKMQEAFRARRGSQARVAETGISPTTVSLVVSGKRVSLPLLLQIARAMEETGVWPYNIAVRISVEASNEQKQHSANSNDNGSSIDEVK